MLRIDRFYRNGVRGSLKTHIQAMLQAVEQDGVDVMGYTAWGCIDLFDAMTNSIILCHHTEGAADIDSAAPFVLGSWYVATLGGKLPSFTCLNMQACETGCFLSEQNYMCLMVRMAE